MVPYRHPLDLVLSQIITFYALQMHFSKLLYFLRALFSGIWCRVFWQFPDPFTPLSWRRRKHVFPKRQQISSGLYGVTFSITVTICSLHLQLGLKISPLLQVFWTKSSAHFSISAMCSRPCWFGHLTVPGGEYKLCDALLVQLPVWD